MAATAEKTKPELWEKVKKKVTAGGKGGRPGQWSARKAQEAVAEYKQAGGGYRGKKSADNHLTQWTKEEWGTKSGRKSKDTGERYLPRKAREKLTDAEYARSTAKKRADTAKGKQFSAQPKDVARKAATARKPAAKRGAPKAASSRATAKPATKRPATRRASPIRTAAKAAPRRATAKAAPKRTAAPPAAKRVTKAAPARRPAAKPAARKAPARKPAARPRAAPRRTSK